MKYHNEWRTHDDVREVYPQAPEDSDIIFADYTYEDYDGNAIVVFRCDGKLFENNDGHCSCYGLERWEPEETSIEALRIRKDWPEMQVALTEFGL